MSDQETPFYSHFSQLNHLRRLAAYNRWAWAEVWPHIELLMDDEPVAYFSERPGFWGSLHGRLAHCYAAEWIWLERLNGRSPGHLPDGEYLPTLEAILYAWRPLQDRWETYLHNLVHNELPTRVSYRNTAGHPKELMLADIVQHVMNHATEHRSQITPLLYELGYATAPLDYMRWAQNHQE